MGCGVDMTELSEKEGGNNSRFQNLEEEVGYRVKLQEIGNRIHAATDLDEILIYLKDEIITLCDADRLTMYAVDPRKRELFSRYKSGEEISEIRIPISLSSIAGFSASKQQLISVKNVYDDSELSLIDPSLQFDRTWDRKSNYATRQVMACPIIYSRYLLGVIQLINRKSGGFFTAKDEQSIQEIARILGIAFFNQRRISGNWHSKFDYLIDTGILRREELKKAVWMADHRSSSDTFGNGRAVRHDSPPTD